MSHIEIRDSRAKIPLKLEEKPWPTVEQYLKNSRKILWPVGSTEQHGPSGILGIDFLTALKVTEAVSAETQIMMAPVIPFGMAVHHMGFPGTITLSPLTYVQMLSELFQGITQHGFQEIYVVNGHGGNIAPITTAFGQCKQKNESHKFKLINWWHLPEVVAYEKEVFGNENGYHATCGEISVTRFTHPEAYKDIAFERLPATPEDTHWPLSPTEFRQHFPLGNMGSQPILSSAAHGEKILNLASLAIQKMVLK